MLFVNTTMVFCWVIWKASVKRPKWLASSHSYPIYTCDVVHYSETRLDQRDSWVICATFTRFNLWSVADSASCRLWSYGQRFKPDPGTSWPTKLFTSRKRSLSSDPPLTMLMVKQCDGKEMSATPQTDYRKVPVTNFSWTVEIGRICRKSVFQNPFACYVHSVEKMLFCEML